MKNPQQILLTIFLLIAAQVCYSTPQKKDLKEKQSIILRFSVEDMILNLSNDGKHDSTLLRVVARTNEMAERDSLKNYVTLFGKAYEELQPQGIMRTMFIGNEAMSSKLKFDSTNEEVLQVLDNEIKAAFDNSFNVIRFRIDRLANVQAHIQNLGNGRVLVELSGAIDKDRVFGLLQTQGTLEFWETWETSEVIDVIFQINDLLADLITENDTLNLTEMEKTQRKYPLFKHLMPNVNSEGYPINGPTVGFAYKSDIPYIDSLLATGEVQIFLQENAPELKFMWSKKAFSGDYYELIALKNMFGEGNPALDGCNIIDARAEFSPMGGKVSMLISASIQMTMNADGTKEWHRLTRENIGRSIAIVLDGYLYSFPRVASEIPNGISSITGNFSVAEATDIATILKSGRCAATFKIEYSSF